MKNILSIMFLTVLFVCGCQSIGSGTAKTVKIELANPQMLEIEGDWQIDIKFGAERNICLLSIDDNLVESCSLKNGKKFAVSLPAAVKPMVNPRLQIELAEPLKEIELAGNSVCRIRDLNTETPLKMDISANTAVFCKNSSADKLEISLEDNSKLSFENKIKNLNIEISEHAVFETDSVGNLYICGEDFSICRIKTANKAVIKVSDNAKVVLGKAKSIEYKAFGNAAVDYGKKAAK